jgi:hypothetical protein
VIHTSARSVLRPGCPVADKYDFIDSCRGGDAEYAYPVKKIKIEHFTIAAREVTWIWISFVGGGVLRAAVGLSLGSRERNGMNGRW